MNLWFYLETSKDNKEFVWKDPNSGDHEMVFDGRYATKNHFKKKEIRKLALGEKNVLS